jgi:O-antigen/teichoic acid export membrane protein
MIKKSLFTFITRAINSFGTVSLSLVLAMFYGSDGLGSYMMAIAALLGVSMVARYGSDLYLLKNGSIHYLADDLPSFKFELSRSVRFVFYNSIFLSILLFLVSQYLIYIEKNFQLGGLLETFSFIIPGVCFLTQISTVLKSILKPYIAPFFEFNFASFILSIMLFFLLHYDVDISLNFIANMHLVIISILLILGLFILYVTDKRIYTVKSSSKHPSLKINKELTDMFLPNFMHYTIQWGTILIIGFLVTESEVGAYSAAHRISFLVNFILIVLNSVTAPHFASYYKNGKNKELEALAIKSTKLMIFLGFPVFIALFFLAEDIFYLIGADFSKSGDILVILIFGQLINVSTGSVALLLNMTGHQYHMRNIMLLSGLVTVILCSVLTTYFGIIGAAISTTFGLILQNLLATWKVYKILKIKSIPGWKWITEFKR